MYLKKHTLTFRVVLVILFSGYTTVKDQSVVTVTCIFVVVLLPESQGDG